MTKKTLIALAVGTVVVVIAAVFAVEQRQSATRPQDQSAELFPDLLERINDVASIKIIGASESFEIRLVDDVWGLVEKDGYPVYIENVKATVVGISAIKTLLPKTDKPERFSELGLADPGAEDGAAVNVILSDASGAEMVSVLLGNRATGGTAKRYVRRFGENKTWLANVNVRIGMTPNDWVETNLMSLGRERFQRAVITQPDGAELIIAKADRDGRDFNIEAIPEGKEAKSPMTNEGVVTALSSVFMEDWAAAAKIPAGDGAPAVARFETFDGLVVTARTKTVGETSWTEFEAAFDPAIRVEPEVDPEDAAANANAEADEEDGGATVEIADSLTAEEVQKEAEMLNDKFAGWAFALPSFKAEQLTRTKESMLAEIAESKTLTGEDAQKDVIVNPIPPGTELNIGNPPQLQIPPPAQE